MNTVMPFLIILVLGGCSAAVLKRWISNKWMNILAGAVVGALLWIMGVYLMLWLTAPNELGPPIISTILYTFLTALASSAVVVAFSPAKQKNASIDDNDEVAKS